MRFVAVLKKSAGAGSRLAEKSFRSRPVKCMSSDPLPLPEIWSDLPEGDAYENARAEFAANRLSGLVLIEYASGFAQSDPQPVVRPPQRAEQPAASERVPSLAPAALAKALADLTAIVTQAEALLRAQGTLRGDVHFAVERIHDVAMALRMRDVDPALCETLDASVREVGDAIVRHEAAATGALSAAGLLRDVMRRIEDLAVVASRSALGIRIRSRHRGGGGHDRSGGRAVGARRDRGGSCDRYAVTTRDSNGSRHRGVGARRDRGGSCDRYAGTTRGWNGSR
jgi:uncharacterized protein YoxC